MTSEKKLYDVICEKLENFINFLIESREKYNLTGDNLEKINTIIEGYKTLPISMVINRLSSEINNITDPLLFVGLTNITLEKKDEEKIYLYLKFFKKYL